MNGILGALLFSSFLVSTILYALPYSQKWELKNEAEDFKVQVEYLWDQIKAFQADRYNSGFLFNDLASFPATVDEMMPSYFVSCSMADSQARRCNRPDITPWGQTITIQREMVTVPIPPSGSINVPGMVITIPFSGEPSEYRRQVFRSELANIPNGSYDETSNQMIYRFGRIGSEVEHQALVRRDGTTTLTGDSWDTGGVSWITNVKGLFLRNTDGSQFSVASGLQRRVIVTSGSFIPQHSCPAGHTPDLDVMIKSIEPQSNATKFTSLGAFLPYHVPAAGGGWHVYAKYFAKLQSGSEQWVVLSDAYLKVTQLCVQ